MECIQNDDFSSEELQKNLIRLKVHIERVIRVYSSFIKKLEQQTESGKLQWDTIFRVSHAYDITENFGYILMSNEYHQVYEVESYGVLDRDGVSFF